MNDLTNCGLTKILDNCVVAVSGGSSLLSHNEKEGYKVIRVPKL